MSEQTRSENLREEKIEIQESGESFQKKKRKFFVKTGLSVRAALKMHKEAGLWGEGDEDWRRVSKHCLAEVARADLLADKFGFSEEIKKDLAVATALHDFYKKREMAKRTKHGLSLSGLMQSSKEADVMLRDRGFSERITRLSGAASLPSLPETEKILSKNNLGEEDIAFLVLHYVDDISTESDWVGPAEIIEGGCKINILDRRLDQAAKSGRYDALNEEGRKFFEGRTSCEEEKRVGHMVEERLAGLLRERGEFRVDDPKDLPYLIDQQVKAKIEAQD